MDEITLTGGTLLNNRNSSKKNQSNNRRTMTVETPTQPPFPSAAASGTDGGGGGHVELAPTSTKTTTSTTTTTRQAQPPSLFGTPSPRQGSLPMATQIDALNQYHAMVKGSDRHHQQQLLLLQQQQRAQMMAAVGGGGGHAHSHGHHSHAHGHHSHGHGQKSCCQQHSTRLPTPTIDLKMAAPEFIRQNAATPHTILGALTVITKMGHYATLLEIVEAWKEYSKQQPQQQQPDKNGGNHPSSTTTDSVTAANAATVRLPDPSVWLQQELQQHPTDREGHSILHWAAKRTEDLRFVQFWMQYISPFTKTTDETGMSPLHWACTEPNSFAIIQYMLTYDSNNDKNTVETNTPTTNQSALASASSGHNVALLELRDASGCTPLLLAAQHGHVETVAFLVHQFQARLDALDHNGDSATHWAAYKGSLPVLGLLAYYEKQEEEEQQQQQPPPESFHSDNDDDVDGDQRPQPRQVCMLTKPDAYGQTPLHLAALRGHSVACQYILKQIIAGSSSSSSGTNNSSHHHHHHHSMSSSERQEQRRAALKLLSLPDKNGRTPYELAVHKKKAHTAARLQQMERTLRFWTQNQLVSSLRNNGNGNGNLGIANVSAKLTHRFRLLFQTIVLDWFCSSHRWKTWLGIPTGMDDPMDVAPAFPNYYVFLQIGLNIWYTYTVFVPLLPYHSVLEPDGVLWGGSYTLTHILQSILILACMYTLYKCQTTNPGTLDEHCSELSQWKQLYGETLASYAAATTAQNNNNNGTTTPQPPKPKYQLCHTCHIARPPRSKHDRALGCCVLLFDHNCPFVGNTIGLYNYKWFYLFLLSMTWYFINHIYLLICYWNQKQAQQQHEHSVDNSSNNVSWLVLGLGLYLPFHILMSASLLIYHTQLTWMNLTTNEHVNLPKYDHFWNNHQEQVTTTTTKPRTATKEEDKDIEQGMLPPTTTTRRIYRNPWNKGVVRNFWDRFHPSPSTYSLPEIEERLLS